MALTFQELILNLSKYWSDNGCVIQQPYDIEKGASTMNPATFLRALGRTLQKTDRCQIRRKPEQTRTLLSISSNFKAKSQQCTGFIFKITECYGH